MSNLQINSEELKRVTLVTASGRIDSGTAPEFDQALKDIINNGQSNIVLQLADVSYMSSAGLRAMVSALRECNKKKGKVVLACPSERISEVLHLAGLDSIFETYPDDTTAVGQF